MTKQMTPQAALSTLEALLRPGINYVCEGCGALLYHNGPDGAIEGGQAGFASRQPWEVVEKLQSCPSCGRRLNADPNPETVKVEAVEVTERLHP